MILTYGLRFGCDVCGVQADGPDRITDESVLWEDQQMPEGWTSLRFLNIQVTDAFASPVRQLCRTCSALTIGEFATKLHARMKVDAQ
jgi:hypothetical protein